MRTLSSSVICNSANLPNMCANEMEYKVIPSPVDAAKLHLRSEVLNSRVAKGFTLAFPNELAKAKVCDANLLLRKYFPSSSEQNQRFYQYLHK